MEKESILKPLAKIRLFLLNVAFLKAILICLPFHSFSASQTFPISPDLSGIDLISGTRKLIHLKEAKRASVVVFLSAKCPCSANHQIALNQLSKEFGSSGFNFIGVHSNANEDLKFSQEYFKKSGLVFPVIQDSLAQIADQFKAYKTPHAFVVNSKLEILFQGGVDNSRSVEKATQHYLKKALMAIQNGQEPDEKNVRVLGCEIKR